MTIHTMSRGSSLRFAGALLFLLGTVGSLGVGEARADEVGLAVVLEPKIDGELTPEELQRLDEAVTEALRSVELQVVPGADREAILDGEPELRGCRTDECQDRIGRLLSAQSVIAQTIKYWRAAAPTTAARPLAAPAPHPKAGRKRRGAAPPPPAPPAPAPESRGTFQITVSLFNVPIGAVGAKESFECQSCGIDKAAQQLSDLIKKLVLSDVTRPRGTIEVTSQPAADVLVDGRKLGFTPYKRAAFVGKHDITVARTGYRSFHKTVEVTEGRKVQVEARLTAGADKQYKEITGPRPKWRLAVGIAALIAGVALAGIGAYDVAIDGQCNASPCARSIRPDGIIVEDVYSTRDVGVGLLIPGLALAAGGAVLTALPGKKQLVEVAGARVGSGAGLRLAGVF